MNLIGLKIPKKQADEIRKKLLNYSLINMDFKIKIVNNHVIIPLTGGKEFKSRMNELNLSRFELVETQFEDYKKKSTSLKDYLKNKISPQRILDIKRSFDIIGDIVILEIPEELENEKYVIGDAALKFTKRRTVYRKKGNIEGVIRTRELEFLAGENSSITIHKEYGHRLMMDVRKVYFSPRLAMERERIINQVNDGEKIIDMFAGIGPFSIAIAHEKHVEIYAIDINPEAIYYMKENIKLNKLHGKINPILGDVKEILKGGLEADRIIMNLPETAYLFLEVAINSLKKGGILHYYEFAHDYDKPLQRIKKAADAREIKLLDRRKVKSKSPGIWQIAIDAKIY